MLIVVCGKSNSGKSTFSEILTSIDEKNIVHLDIDKIVHKINDRNDVIESVVRIFGKDVLDNGKINRRKLGNIVFNSSKEMEKLKTITWKYIEYEIDKFIYKNKSKIIILDYIMLTETKYFDLSNLKVLVKSSYDNRLKRALIRDNITEKLFELRDKSSIEYIDNEFDYVINNDSNTFKFNIESVYKSIIEKLNNIN